MGNQLVANCWCIVCACGIECNYSLVESDHDWIDREVWPNVCCLIRLNYKAMSKYGYDA